MSTVQNVITVALIPRTNCSWVSKPHEIATLTSLGWVVTVLRFEAFMNLIKKSMIVEPSGTAASFGHLFFRVSAGMMIFYIHGLHKLEGWIAYLPTRHALDIGRGSRGNAHAGTSRFSGGGNTGAVYLLIVHRFRWVIHSDQCRLAGLRP